MSSEQFDKLIFELQTLTKLLAISVLKDKNQTERVSLLADYGFENKEIANLLGISDDNVRAVKSNIAKSLKKVKVDKKGQDVKQQKAEKNVKN